MARADLQIRLSRKDHARLQIRLSKTIPDAYCYGDIGSVREKLLRLFRKLLELFGKLLQLFRKLLQLFHRGACLRVSTQPY